MKIKKLLAMTVGMLILALEITTLIFGAGAAIANTYLFAMTLAIVTLSIFIIPLGIYGLRVLKLYSFSQFDLEDEELKDEVEP